jgi:phage N-6-adenine-methyltransferase
LQKKCNVLLELSSLKLVDDRIDPDEDSYETDDKLLERLENQYGLLFNLDAAANGYNTKCVHFLDDALHQEWVLPNKERVDVWCNPPHSLNEEFIKRADIQHKKHNINICMIVPTNCQSMPTWHKLIESETKIITENHPLKKRPTFFKLGRKTKFPSRNAYRVIIWRKKLG